MTKANWWLVLILALSLPDAVFAAVGCSLDDPDRDIARIFPDSTGYRTTFVTINDIGGKSLRQRVEQKLGDKLEPVYESLDVPYAYYTVLKGKEVIGYVHGVNQKGKFGALQLVLATDQQEKIIDFYYQKISSPESDKFRDPSFTVQFKSRSLADFLNGTPAINPPGQTYLEDFQATLRGVKKDLILLDEFLSAGKTKGD